MHELAANKNVFVGTVDYGDMLFFPKWRKATKLLKMKRCPILISIRN